MYTSYIGKKFLQRYREKEGKPDDYTARQFFDEVMFPLFFDDDKHLMHVGNSPFFQKPKEEDVKLYGSRSKAQYNNFKQKAETGIASGAIYVGFAAEEIQATSTGQLTSMNFNINSEDIYASWIGEAFGVGVSGGFVMLIDKPEILFGLFAGWLQYRKYLQQTPNLKDRQIETWNGHWLCHALSKDYDEIDPIQGFQVQIEEVLGKMAIPTKDWVKVIFALSQRFSQDKSLTVYAYNLSQTNTTFGFINIFLPEIRRPFELRDAIFMNKKEVILSDKQIADLATFYTFKNACRMGTIGLKALEPAKLREFMPKNTLLYAQGKDYKFTDENSYINYSLYKLWIIAMLNKTELLQLAAEVAQSLISLEKAQESGGRGKNTQNQNSKELLEAKSLKSFIDGLTENINASNGATFKNVVEQLVKMPSDNFPLFLTLIRFEYAYQKSNS